MLPFTHVYQSSAAKCEASLLIWVVRKLCWNPICVVAEILWILIVRYGMHQYITVLIKVAFWGSNQIPVFTMILNQTSVGENSWHALYASTQDNWQQRRYNAAYLHMYLRKQEDWFVAAFMVCHDLDLSLT